MIESLSINNITIINQLEINFDKGLNILSGETGAGKSIIIDSINFVMGSRVLPDFLKQDKEKGEVSALITLNDERTLELVRTLSVPIEEDCKLHISRTIDSNNKTTLRINGKLMSLGILKEISNSFIDIHGQFEHQYLADESKHILLLDKFCHDQLAQLKKALNLTIESYKETNSKITTLENQTGDIDDLMEEIQELTELTLTDGEEDALTERLNFLSNYKEIANSSIAIMELLDSDDGVIHRIYQAQKYLDTIVELDTTKEILQGTLENVSIQLEDVLRTIDLDSDDYDPQELLYVEERISTLQTVKRKYKKTIPEIIEHLKQLQIKQDELDNIENILAGLKTERKTLQSQIKKCCDEMTQLRQEAKHRIEKDIITNLLDLGMKNVQFEVELSKKTTFSKEGNDHIRFLIAPNLGSELKPLAKIASGGEMSRVMLALKIVLATANTTEVFIFDEIDTGVSGRTAQKLGEKILQFSKNRQILCISHLPQIASMADKHLLIEKTTENNETISTVKPLDDRGMIKEIARLIGGAKITETTISAAEEMKQLANHLK